MQTRIEHLRLEGVSPLLLNLEQLSQVSHSLLIQHVFSVRAPIREYDVLELLELPRVRSVDALNDVVV